MTRSVSVVIPTLNNPRLLSECLFSLRKQSYPRGSIEVVVVDNGQGDVTSSILKTRFPDVRRVEPGKNLGFAEACNRGAAASSGEYVAFLNDDAAAEPGWLEGLFAGLEAGGEDAVCAASHIRSHDGREVEFSGASSNLFGVGRPRSLWGWPGSLQTPGEGSPLLFASGGAMLIHRETFLSAGGFDPHFFAYFEDVDLGWRLWALGHRVVYTPGAVVRHIGGSTGSKSGAHRRYTLWECNSLATVLKNYESGNMERILAGALLLLYKRALLSAGDALKTSDYSFVGAKDTNPENVERLPRVSVAHIAAIRRFNSLVPRFMEERRRIQALRVRSDAEILPLLGRAYEPQFAGREYAAASRALARGLRLFDITREAAPNKVLVLASTEQESEATALAVRLVGECKVALVMLAENAPEAPVEVAGLARHALNPSDPSLLGLLEQADAAVVFPFGADLHALSSTETPVALVGDPSTTLRFHPTLRVSSPDDPRLVAFCRDP